MGICFPWAYLIGAAVSPMIIGPKVGAALVDF